MHTIQLILKLKSGTNTKTAYDAIERYLSACRMNGQILGREWSVAYRQNAFYSYVLAPEKSSLDSKYSNKWVKKALENLKDIGLSLPNITVIGKDPGSMPVGKISDSRWCVLYTDYLTLESPVRTGTGFNPIPLYALPKTTEDEYNDIICWETDYQSCDSLQMNCFTGEKFGTREMTDLQSSLTRRGLAICKILTKSTHIPFYYYLHRASGRSVLRESSRECPSCGSKKWKLAVPLFGWIDFKCDKCRLLSTIPSQFQTRTK